MNYIVNCAGHFLSSDEMYKIKFAYNGNVKEGWVYSEDLDGDFGVSEGRNMGGAQMWSVKKEDILEVYK